MRRSHRLGFLLTMSLIGQAANVTATVYVSRPVFGGSIAWAIPQLTVVLPDGIGFLGVATFQGRFVVAERDGVATTSADGVTWAGHALPGSDTGPAPLHIAAANSRVSIIGQGVAWVSTDGAAWTAAGVPPRGPAQPTAMTGLADGFVAVGIAPGGRRAAVWRSSDGNSWMETPDQAAFDHFCPTAVTASQSSHLVAVGDDCYPYLARPAAATSDDGGLTWQRAPGQTQLSEEGRLTAVVAGGPGFIAAGAIIRDVYPGLAGTALYVSSDGLAWRRVGFFAQPSTGASRIFLNAIPGGYLAIATGAAKPATFVSVDRLRWTSSATLPATPHATDDDFDDAVNGFAVSGNVIVGVGTTDHVRFVDEPQLGGFTVVGTLTPSPAAIGQIPVPPAVPTPRPPAVSPQPSFPGSISWAVASLPVALPPGVGVLASTVLDVTRWRGGFAAVGSESFRSPPSFRDVVWTSPDGVKWTEHPLPLACGSTDLQIAATPTTIVVTGEGGICRSPDAVRWTRATDTPHGIRGLLDVIAAGPGFVLTMAYYSAATVSVKVWRSADGLHWRTAGHPAAFAELEPRAVANGSRGLVILGRRFIPGIGFDTAFLPLRSPDGLTWSRGVRQRAFEPLSFDLGRASMVRGGPGYVVAGSYQPRSRTGAAVWTSPDGLAWKRVHLVLPASGFVEFDGLARIGPGYAVVGLVAPPSQEDPARPTIWLSPDATHWRSGVNLPFPTDGPVAWVDITGVAGGSARVVAVGVRSEQGGSSHAQVWTGTYQAP